MNNNKILIIDIETTGFLSNKGCIVEIGIVELCLKTGHITTLFDSLLREPMLTEAHQHEPYGWIFHNSNLTFEQIISAPPSNIVYAQVQNIVNQYPQGATAYNNSFDFDFLEDRGIRFLRKLPCPMRILTPIMKLPSKYGYPGYKWPNCEEAYHYCFKGSNYIESHRGADDAKHEAHIVFDLYDKGLFEV